MLKRNLFLAIIVITALIFLANVAIAADTSEKDDGIFPSFGTGPVEVRIYASYFCPPCRALEPELEPLLEELVETNKIQVTFVDVPMGQSAPYIHYFLYALNNDKSMKNAIKVRHILFDVAKAHGGPEDIREAFEKEGVAYEPFDLTEVFLRFNQFLSEDSIRSTPSAAIHKDEKNKTITGGRDIIAAMKELINNNNNNNE